MQLEDREDDNRGSQIDSQPAATSPNLTGIVDLCA